MNNGINRHLKKTDDALPLIFSDIGVMERKCIDRPYRSVFVIIATRHRECRSFFSRLTLSDADAPLMSGNISRVSVAC